MNVCGFIASRYLSAHKKRTRLAILSILLSVALVTAIFSMLDVFLQFEKIQVMHDFGNYHMLIRDASEAEKSAVSSRVDVQNAGVWISFKNGTVGDRACSIAALDRNFAPNMELNLTAGAYPQEENELMLESWAAEALGVAPGDTVSLAFVGQAERTFLISGLFSDYGSTKAAGEPGVMVSMAAAKAANAEKTSLLLIQFKDRTDMRKAERQIRDALALPLDRVDRNERLLAVIGQSDHKAATGFYQVGGILFLIVLLAGVVMIYNAFNISVMERVRQFGLLRCVGASRSQIRKLVRREGLLLLRWALPLGLLLGMAVTLFCCALLKFYNSYLFSEIPLFTFSPIGSLAGAVVGFLTVQIASMLPARKAARVSPVNAVTGSGETKVKKTKKKGLLTRLLPVETAMGIEGAVMKKKTLALMSASIALSIILFLGFQVFISFMYTNLKTTKPYTPDLTLTSEAGLGSDLYARLKTAPGVKRAYGRMFRHVNAAFDASRLTDLYKQAVGGVKQTNDGLFVAPERSWLISYDANQLKWAKSDLLEGSLSEEAMNEQNGVIAVLYNTRKGVSMQSADLRIGDKVYVETPSGKAVLTVTAVLRSVPFADSNLNLTTLITTEQLFTKLTGQSAYQVIDLQLTRGSQEETIAQIRTLMGPGTELRDSRQQNSEINQTFVTMAVFVYGFVAVIALISILNIVSTMNTSILSKTKYLGVLRAVGMSGRQQLKMVAAEAGTYCVTGAVAGCILGALLQKALIENYFTAMRVTWQVPLAEIFCVLIAAALVTGLSILGPMKKIRSTGIPDVIGSL